MDLYRSSLQSMLRQHVESAPAKAVAQEVVLEAEPQTPDWVRRCVASYLHKGGKSKKAPGGLDREGVSKAFAICTAQYKKLDNPELKDETAVIGKKAKTRAAQYQKILSKVRKGPEKGG